MKLELQSAANFFIHLIMLGRRSINPSQLEKLRLSLVDVLRRRYRHHWFPEKPFKGSGYRCIRINGKMDSVISQACDTCDLSPHLVHSALPSELTMWIDPQEVSYRIGENGAICVLYEYKEGFIEPWKPGYLNKRSDKRTNENENGAYITTTDKKTKIPSKDSLRKMDYLLDPRKSISIELLQAYVSSS